MKTLTKKQRLAVDALIEGEPVTAAAERAGVNRRQVYRWLSESETFCDVLKQSESQVLAAVIRKLAALANDAVDVLGDALEGNAKALQVRAADVVLSRLLTWRELISLEERVAALEQQR